MKFLVVAAALLAVALAADQPTFDLRGSFDLADANKDGKIVAAEFDALYASFDDNGDGSINITEFASHYIKTGMSAKGSVYIFYRLNKNNDGGIDRAEVNATFTKFDLSGDDEVVYAEYAGVMSVILRELAEAGATGAKLDVMFTKADANGDKQLTGEELWSALSPADTSGDGLLSPDEFKVYWMAQTDEPENRTIKLFEQFDFDKSGFIGEDEEKARLFLSFDTNKDHFISKDEFDYVMLYYFHAIIEELESDAMVTNGVDLQQNFDGMDTNSDGIVSESEFVSVFKGMDVDNSGDVNVTEYVTFVMSAAKLTLRETLLTFFLTDANEDSVIDDGELKVSYSAFDVNNDGKMEFEEYKVVETSFLRLLAEAKISGAKISAMIDAADVNADGNLNGDELWSIISAADLNADGIDQAEFATFWMAKTGQNRYESNGLFKIFDSNMNGYFGDDEMEKSAFYKGVDYDKDGVLTVDEFKNAMVFLYARVVRSMSHNSKTFDIVKAFDHADLNKDGFISNKEFPDPAAKEVNITEMIMYYADMGLSTHGALYLFFRTDGNDDNKLSRDEMVESFNRIDKNDDGRLTLAEYSAYMNGIFADLKIAAATGAKLDVMFAGADSNMDNSLNITEMASLFLTADTSMNGEVSEAEFKTYWQANTNEPDSRTDLLFGYLDSDDDGSFGNDQEAVKLFDSFDYNDDNMVSKDEFDNSMLFLFAKIQDDLETAKAAKEVIGFFF